MSFRVPESARVTWGPLKSDQTYGNNGAFLIHGPHGRTLRVMASDGQGWEHVSVSIDGKPKLTPSWPEMCFVKAEFWGDNDVVIQYHPAKSDYVNHHPGCLHLWRPIGVTLPLPDPEMVGPRV